MSNGGGIHRFPYSMECESEGHISVSIYNPRTEDTLTVGEGKVETITAYAGDYGYDLMFTFYDADGKPMNLNDTSIKFQMKKVTDSEMKVNEDCIIISVDDGTCAYSIGEDDFDEYGEFDVRLRVVMDEREYTLGGLKIQVIPRFKEAG